MATVIQHEELVQRALRYVMEKVQEKAVADLSVLVDDAGARFNLSPRDQQALEHLLADVCKGKMA